MWCPLCGESDHGSFDQCVTSREPLEGLTPRETFYYWLSQRFLEQT